MRLGEANSNKELGWKYGGTSLDKTAFIGQATKIIRVKDNDEGLEFALLTIDSSGNVETPGYIRSNDKFNVSGNDGETTDINVVVPGTGVTTFNFMGGILIGHAQ